MTGARLVHNQNQFGLTIARAEPIGERYWAVEHGSPCLTGEVRGRASWFRHRFARVMSGRTVESAGQLGQTTNFRCDVRRSDFHGIIQELAVPVS